MPPDSAGTFASRFVVSQFALSLAMDVALSSFLFVHLCIANTITIQLSPHQRQILEDFGKDIAQPLDVLRASLPDEYKCALPVAAFSRPFLATPMPSSSSTSSSSSSASSSSSSPISVVTGNKSVAEERNRILRNQWRTLVFRLTGQSKPGFSDERKCPHPSLSPFWGKKPDRLKVKELEQAVQAILKLIK